MIRLLEDVLEVDNLVFEPISVNEAMVKSYAGRKRKVVIPEEIEGYTIVKIGAGAFQGKKQLADVILPSTVTAIDNDAFSKCVNLRSINISGVTEIGSCCFLCCASLENVELSSELKKLPCQAFSGCHSLKAINLPLGLQSIGERCFSWCYSLYDITLPNSLRELGDGVFEGCGSLIALDIPNSITVLGEKLFDDSGIQKVGLPQSFTEVPEAFFAGSHIRSIAVPGNIKRICSCAFRECWRLQNVILPEGLTSIDDDAFVRCKNLKEIVIPSTVKEIGSGAFWGSGLENIVFEGDESQVKIAQDAFSYTPYERNITSKLPAISDNDYEDWDEATVRDMALDLPF